MQFDNVMTLKKISLAAALFLFSLAAHCAEFTQLLCKAEESTTSYFPKGKAIEVPVEKLTEEGTEYVVRAWHFSNDIFRVSRSSGEFSYATAISRFEQPALAKPSSKSSGSSRAAGCNQFPRHIATVDESCRHEHIHSPCASKSARH